MRFSANVLRSVGFSGSGERGRLLSHVFGRLSLLLKYLTSSVTAANARIKYGTVFTFNISSKPADSANRCTLSILQLSRIQSLVDSMVSQSTVCTNLKVEDTMERSRSFK